MGSALRKVFKQKPVTILFFGLHGVGKTTMMYRIKLEEVMETVPTEGFCLQPATINGNLAHMWEIVTRDGSNEVFRHFAAHSDAIVFMIDSSDRERFPEIVDDFFVYINDRVQEKHIPVLVLANKQDKPDVMSSEEIRDAIFHRGGAAFRENTALEVFPVVALTSEGVDLALDWLTSQLALKMARKSLLPDTSCSQKPSSFMKSTYAKVVGLFSTKKDAINK